MEKKLWDVDTGKEKLELKPDNYVQSLAFSPDGKTLAVGMGGGLLDPPGPSSVVLWDVTTGKERARTLPAKTGWISWVTSWLARGVALLLLVLPFVPVVTHAHGFFVPEGKNL